MDPTLVTPCDNEDLLRVLGEAQRIGTLGPAPCQEIIRHATWFADVLPAEVTRVIDLGSGAGIPGLVVALVRPTLQIVLVDRRVKCTDALHRAVSVLELTERVSVYCGDVDDICHTSGWQESFDAAISRGFGPPLQTLTYSTAFVRPGGWIVISEPPIDIPDRWSKIDISKMGLSGPDRRGPIALFHVEQSKI